MLSIILSGHGGFATGLEKAMKQILGEQPQVIAIDFPESSSTALLTAQFEEALASLDQREGLIFNGFTRRYTLSCSFYSGNAESQPRSDHRSEFTTALGDGAGARWPQ